MKRKAYQVVRTQMLRSFFPRLAAIVLLAALFTTAPFHAALAATAPSLGTAQSFAVLGGSTVTNTGPTTIIGDLGVSPGTALTGFPPGLVTGGTIHVADALAGSAQSDTTTAYNNLAGQSCNHDLTGQDLVGMTLVPGVYCFSSSAQLTGTLTLDAAGNPDAVWVFQIGSTLTTASNSSVVVINGGQQCNVFWQVGSSAILGTTTTFIGNILALTSITLNTGANVSGRTLAQNGATTLDTNHVAISVCAVPPVGPIPPTLGKAFSPATINAGGTSTLTITLANPNTSSATLSAPLIDTLPSGVVIAPTPNAGTTCGGLVTATPGGSTVTLASSASSIPANGSCTVTVDVTAPVGGSYFNSLAVGALQTSNGNNAAPAVATLTVLPPAGVAPPTLGKAFSPTTTDAGGTATLTLTLANPNSSSATLSAQLIDTLPTGVVIAPTPNATTTCGGAVTATPGGSTVTLASSGSSIPANSSCTVTVDVIAPVGGSYFNSLAAGALQTSNGNNAAPAIATLTVNAPAGVRPTLSKAFTPATVAAGGTSTLTLTLANPNTSSATLSAQLIDTLPTGVVIATTPNATTTCGGAVTATPGGSTVTLASSGNSIPANSSCTVTVDVIAPVGGSYFNSLAAGALQTSNGNNAAPAIATLTVLPPAGVAPPTLAKAFSPATINAGGISTLTITLSNSSTVATLTAALIDTLPSGLVVATTPNAGTTCDGGTVTAVANASTVTLSSGSTIPANSSCTVTVDVIAAVGGSYFNSLAAGVLQTNHGFNAAPAVATLTATPATPAANEVPTLSKSFSPATINAGGISTVTIILTNPGDTAATIIAPFIDTLPSGLVVAGSGPNASTTSGGTLTAIAGQSTVTLTGGSIPANSFVIIKFDVYAPVAGTYVNTLASGTLQTSNGNNTVSVGATLIVNPRPAGSPTLKKSFSPTIINAGKVSTLTITLSNPTSTVATLIAPLTDYFPGGLVVAGTGPNASTTCGGTLTAITGATKIILTGGSIPANSSCTVKVDVTAKYKGSYCNKLPAGALQTNNGSNVNSASATLSVYLEPRLSKSFSPSIINAGKISTLTITLSNPNSSAAASLTAPLIDTLPSGMVVAGSGNFSNSCGGTLTATAGDLKVTLTGGAIPANGSCTVTVPVTAKYKGSYSNKLPVGALQTNKGSNVTAAGATLSVYLEPRLSKSFSPAIINAGKVSILTITLSNPNSSAAANLTAPLTDTFPGGLVVAGVANVATTCGGTLTATPGGTTIILKGGSIPANGSCTVKVDVTAKYKGNYWNKLPAGALQTDKGGNVSQAFAVLTVNQ